VVEAPEKQIKDLQILSGQEEQQLLSWNNTRADYPKDKCIHALFEEQVERTPDNVALVFGEEFLTYRQLNERANQLGHYLQTKGVKAESLVGICLERSLDMMVGLFGILKAGGAYVPIDPTHPQERISYIVNDSGCTILLTHEAIKEKLPPGTAEIVCLDDPSVRATVLHQPSTPVSADTTASNLVYVIYTSGSTGNPKGTLIEHKALVNRLTWMQRAYPLNEKDTLLQKTTYTFDVSVWELFWWSLYGAKLCLLKPGGEKEPEAILEAIERHEVSTIHFVPSMYGVFLEYVQSSEGLSKVASLRHIFASGEALTPSHVGNSGAMMEQNGTRLINLYGPTEATIDVSYYNCSVSDRLIPIGKPISNIELYIIDKYHKQVAIGIAGELCIAGDGLARGYLNREALTNEKFISHGFGGKGQGRLYKTGDLARFLPDGNIEYLGRIDNQVKIRGFRIELGEIEANLDALEEVGSNVVLAKKDKFGSNRLVAYVVPSKAHELNVEKFRETLAKSLPDYMIPNLFVRLETMPLTLSGKVDRKALPDPEDNYELSNIYVAPQTETEKKLADIWKEVLGVEKIGIHDNFFELGGHSLTVTQVVSKIRIQFKKELALKGLFENSTIHALSNQIDSNELGDELEIIKKATHSSVGQIVLGIHDVENQETEFEEFKL